jgi:hypothetical protein
MRAQITTCPGRCPAISATVFHCCTGARPMTFSIRFSRGGPSLDLSF